MNDVLVGELVASHVRCRHVEVAQILSDVRGLVFGALVEVLAGLFIGDGLERVVDGLVGGVVDYVLLVGVGARLVELPCDALEGRV